MREREGLVVSTRDRDRKKSRSRWLKLLVEFCSKQHLRSRSRTRGGKPELILLCQACRGEGSVYGARKASREVNDHNN